MIRIAVELWPKGDEKRKHLLAEMFVANDGTGSATVGNYDVIVMTTTGKVSRRGQVKKHPRKAVSVWKLVAKAIEAVQRK